jgi:hypothetical protein
MSKTVKEWIPYLAGLGSIAFGAFLLWWPPQTLAADPGAVGIALAFITAGFAALGVTVTVSRALEIARAQGYAQGQLAATAGTLGGPGHPDCGHGHIHLHTKNKGDIVELAAKAARAWSLVPGHLVNNETFDSVNAMEDPFDQPSGPHRPKGSLVIVEVLMPTLPRHSEAAHLRLIDIMTALDNDTNCRQYLQPNKVQHWCCWSDH